MSTLGGYTTFFERATGTTPYEYQCVLGDAPAPPDILEVPTGSGKTQALLISWIYGRRARGDAPRRLVYALPMRTLVEQTVQVAVCIRDRLGLSHEELPIHVLMGGEEPPKQDWRQRPEADQILIGTIDMLLSRALNRGYAESRFAWPVAFGLLNSDCRWVFDEVQLMGPARATSAQLDGLRTALGTALACETIWVSATVDRAALKTFDRPKLGTVMSLPGEDRSGTLHKRLNARKVLERVDLAGKGRGALPRPIAELALRRHMPGTRTLVVLNTVALTQATYRHLRRLNGKDGPATVLLHSRFRSPERKEQMDHALAPPDGPGTIVVATQVIEAGVDVSAATLITETAPFASIVQRVGRCNRAGERDEASVLWIDTGAVADDAAGRKAAAPYPPEDIEASRETLIGLQGSSLSPAALMQIDVLRESRDDPAVLRRRDLLDLFDTSPDLSGMDIDIAPFIRDDDDRNATVLFRELSADAPARIANQPAPEPDELVQVPLASLRDRTCWTLDHLDGEWVQRPGRGIPPGATVMLRASDGGYDPELGWDEGSTKAVTPIQLEEATSVEGMSSDAQSAGKRPQELCAHLAEVAEEVSALARALHVEQWRDPLHAAGSLHDVGKAHPVFQKTLRGLIDVDQYPDRDELLWAKSGHRGGRHERSYFRHELASALAITALDGVIELPYRHLTAYLVAAHHGKVRVSIRPALDEERPRDAAADARFALGIVDGDLVPAVETPIGSVPPAVLDLACMELGADDSWTDAAVALRDRADLGPFRLAFLEALLRVADWRASA